HVEQLSPAAYGGLSFTTSRGSQGQPCSAKKIAHAASRHANAPTSPVDIARSVNSAVAAASKRTSERSTIANGAAAMSPTSPNHAGAKPSAAAPGNAIAVASRTP